MQAEEPLLRLAVPQYLNTLPLLFFLKEIPGVKIDYLVPTKINQALKERFLEGGLASSFFYAKNFQDFWVLPDLSISAVGEVKSVILYHQEPLEELHQKIIGISPETETSFGLLRIVLEEFLKLTPFYKFLSKKLIESRENDWKELTGYLAIGDEALLLEKRDIFPYALDLAKIWLTRTHLPFVFALFVVRKDLREPQKELLRKFLGEIYLARAKGLASLERIVAESNLKFSKKKALNYLQYLEYDFSGLKQRAFLKFCEYLKKIGMLSKIPENSFFNLRDL